MPRAGIEERQEVDRHKSVGDVMRTPVSPRGTLHDRVCVDPRIVAWTPEGRSQERLLERAFDELPRAICCRSEHELWQTLSEQRARLLLLELGLPSHRSVESLVELVHARFPVIRIVAYGWLSPRLAADVLACARVGLGLLALHGHDELRTLVLRTLAEEKGAEEVVFQEIAEWLPPVLIPTVRLLMQRMPEAPNLEQLTRALGQSPRMLQRAAIHQECCGPSRLIRAVRVLVAIRLLTHDRIPMQEVLARTGYDSVRELRTAMKRCEMASPRQPSGALAYAASRDAVLCLVSARYRSMSERSRIRCRAGQEDLDESVPEPKRRLLRTAASAIGR
jgi:AraC-like DNA-binding protein